MIELIYEETQDKFEAAIDSFKRDLSRMRTGRANLSILEGITVVYYGSPTPLNQVAAVNIADPRLITIKPWEKTMLTAIEKALITADIGITPSNDGEIIRLPIPPLSGERRKEIVKSIKKAGEETKVSVRNGRRDANSDLKSLDGVSEDEVHKATKKIQDMTDKAIALVDELTEAKEKEIMEF